MLRDGQRSEPGNQSVGNRKLNGAGEDGQKQEGTGAGQCSGGRKQESGAQAR